MDRVVAYPRIGSGLGLKSLLKPKTVLRIYSEDGSGWLQLIQNPELSSCGNGLRPAADPQLSVDIMHVPLVCAYTGDDLCGNLLI